MFITGNFQRDGNNLLFTLECRRIQSNNKIYNPDYVQEQQQQQSGQGMMREERAVSSVKLLEPTFDDMKQMVPSLKNIVFYFHCFLPFLSCLKLSKSK